MKKGKGKKVVGAQDVFKKVPFNEQKHFLLKQAHGECQKNNPHRARQPMVE